MPKFTKAPASLVALFGRAIETLPGVEPRQMFGYPAAFVNGLGERRGGLPPPPGRAYNVTFR